MSWSISMSGKPAEISKKLDDHSADLSGQSKVEFDAAKDHLAALVNNNFEEGGDDADKQPTISLVASGYGSMKDGEQYQRACSVTLKRG